MKITKMEGIPCSLPRKDGGRGSNVVLVKIHTDEGIIGAADGGTCDQNGVMLALRTWGPILLGGNPFDIGLIMNRLLRGFGGGNLPAAGIVDFALHDIIGKALKMPVYQLLGGKACPKLGIGMMISHGTPEERASLAGRVVAAGIRNIVCKVGPGWGTSSVFEDVANLKAIRRAVGNEVYLGVDANGGLDYSTALDLCMRLEEFNLYKVEQPLPSWDVDGMARLQKKLHTPVWAHESAIEISGLLDCIKKDACDGVCIKVVWTGGIIQSRRWAAIAEAANLAISCGSMVGSGYEAAAQAHFLAADPWMTKFPHANLGPPLLHDQWDTTDPPITDDLSLNPPVFKGGYFYAPEGPGLGLELNEKIIPKLLSKGMSPVVIERQ
jgi:L-alanine-DL-glutamate epimerase-like enolase superfamily enzyme